MPEVSCWRRVQPFCGQRVGVVDRGAELDPVADLPVGPEVLGQRREHVRVRAARRRHVAEVGVDDVLVGSAHRVARGSQKIGVMTTGPVDVRAHHRAAVEDQWRSAPGRLVVACPWLAADGFGSCWTYQAAEATHPEWTANVRATASGRPRVVCGGMGGCTCCRQGGDSQQSGCAAARVAPRPRLNCVACFTVFLRHSRRLPGGFLRPDTRP